jgi:deoxyhypusine synthase
MSNTSNTNQSEPKGALDAVFVESVEMPEGSVLIQGPDFNKKLSLSDLLDSYKRMGYQASSLGEGIDIIKEMVKYIHTYSFMHYCYCYCYYYGVY